MALPWDEKYLKRYLEDKGPCSFRGERTWDKIFFYESRR